LHRNAAGLLSGSPRSRSASQPPLDSAIKDLNIPLEISSGPPINVLRW